MQPFYERNGITIYCGDNLCILNYLSDTEKLFDLVEVDGPYMAGLEHWDNMTEDEYIKHYADRLTLTRRILQPWGVVFIFGYPEGCAEIKSWARRAKTLYLRRWITWYKQVTSHKGRKVENILLFWRDAPVEVSNFGKFLRSEREKRGWTLRDVGEQAGRPWWHRGGNLYYENGNGGYPSLGDMFALSRIFDFKVEDWPGVFFESYGGLTDIDYINHTYPEDTQELNNNGLRSKPVQLYIDLFRPTLPPTDKQTALILYGGSGNAGIAAAVLGYDVVICEANIERCKAIVTRWDKMVNQWQQRLSQLSIFDLRPQPKQLDLFQSGS